MTLNELLQEVIKDIDVKKRPTFINANKFDANFNVDDSNFPVCVLVEPVTSKDKFGPLNELLLSFPISLIWGALSKTDFKQEDHETKCIQPMREVSALFLSKLKEHPLVKSIENSERTNFTNLFDVNMSGVYHRLTLNFEAQGGVC